MALTGLSTGLNYMGAQKAQAAQDDAMSAERQRQGRLDQEASALNLTSQDRYQGFEGKQDEKAASLADYFTGQEVTPPPASEALPQTSSNIVTRETAKQQGQAKDFTDRTGTALGNLRAFGDLLGGIGREQAQDAMSIGQVGGFKRGSSSVLPYELDDASHAGDSYKFGADLAGGLGSIGVSAGLSGGNLPFFGGGTTPATAAAPVARAGIVADPWANMRKAGGISQLYT